MEYKLTAIDFGLDEKEKPALQATTYIPYYALTASATSYSSTTSGIPYGFDYMTGTCRYYYY